MSNDSQRVKPAPTPAADSARRRLAAIDTLRGLVVVLMALDHTRDYFGRMPFSPVDLAQAGSLLFLTRWVTHFCAPVYIFLTGVSAFLYETKHHSRQRLARFLLSRGLWLIAVELLLINAVWQTGWHGLIFIQVIWVIGVSMVLLAGMIYLPPAAILIIAAAAVLGHNLLDGIEREAWGGLAWLRTLLHQRGWVPTGPGHFGVVVIYPLVPWFGVMAAGYLAGPVFLADRARRKRLLTRVGWGMCALFLVLRAGGIYGDPNAWALHERGPIFSLLALLNATKYPPSLQFLLMTLGPALILLPRLEGHQGVAKRALTVFGSVPFFFYVLHVPLINLINHLWNWAVYDRFSHFLYGRVAPEGYQGSLLLTYPAWLLVLAIMFPACRWFADIKRRRHRWWMSYL